MHTQKSAAGFGPPPLPRPGDSPTATGLSSMLHTRDSPTKWPISLRMDSRNVFIVPHYFGFALVVAAAGLTLLVVAVGLAVVAVGLGGLAAGLLGQIAQFLNPSAGDFSIA